MSHPMGEWEPRDVVAKNGYDDMRKRKWTHQNEKRAKKWYRLILQTTSIRFAFYAAFNVFWQIAAQYGAHWVILKTFFLLNFVVIFFG